MKEKERSFQEIFKAVKVNLRGKVDIDQIDDFGGKPIYLFDEKIDDVGRKPIYLFNEIFEQTEKDIMIKVKSYTEIQEGNKLLKPKP